MPLLMMLSQSRFPAGQTVMTAGVAELARQGLLDPAPYLRRHLNADWGDLDDGDRRLNNRALTSDERLFSSYQVTPDITLWIITEPDRSVTTLLLPDEY